MGILDWFKKKKAREDIELEIKQAESGIIWQMQMAERCAEVSSISVEEYFQTKPGKNAKEIIDKYKARLVRLKKELALA